MGYFVLRRELVPHHFTYEEKAGRPTEDVSPQLAPDPIRQGLTPARPARMPITLFYSPLTGRGSQAWEEEWWSVYGVGKHPFRAPYTTAPPSGDRIAAGRMSVFTERFNLLRDGGE